MKKFIALYMAERSAIDAMMKAPPEEMKKGMDAWMAWDKANKKSIAELGAPLGKTKRITAKGMSDTRNEITGYSIVEGDSFESAAKIFKGHPHLQHPGCTIDLLEIMPIPGMQRAGGARFAAGDVTRAFVNRFCATLPGAEHSDPWGGGHDAWKVGGKLFAVIGATDEAVSMKCRDVEAAELLIELGRAERAPYFHRS